MYSTKAISKIDPEVAIAIEKETDRQRNKIELIASENFVSEAVLEALGSPLTNKYAEGYPERDITAAVNMWDVVEELAIERAKELFGAEHVNVQPHAGAQANNAVYFAVLKPGDTIMGMDLSHGGHLSHGMSKNISGQYYKPVFYGVREKDSLIDFDQVRKIAREYKPKLIVTGASAYPRIIDFKAFKEIADEIGAFLMADIAHIAGLVAAGLHPSPVPHADFVTTTTHKTLRGPRGGMIMCKEKHGKKIDSAVFPGTQGGPLMHVIAAKAVSFREAQKDEFKVYQQQIIRNSKALAEALKRKGFDLVSGGTDNHLVLIDVSNKGVTGKQAQLMLDEVGITVNKNSIPFDKQGPFITSGIRIGTPAITTRGMNEGDMDELADIIYLTLVDFQNSKGNIVNRVKSICGRYPLY